jgi:hypothetical protein
MGLFFREIRSPDLLSDLSNLSEIDLASLLRELKGPRQREILAKLLQELLAVARAGKGVQYAEIPPPFKQVGLECQTMALINGLVAIGEGNHLSAISSDIRKLVESIRTAVQQVGLRGETGSYDPTRESSVNTDAHFSMTTVASQLPKLGIPLRRQQAADNPIKLTRELFVPRHFMGVGKADAWHGKAVVPLAGATSEQFAAELDSLTGTKRVIGVQEFMLLTLNRDSAGQDTFEIYSI